MEEGEKFFSSGDERAQHIRRILRLKEGDSFRAGIINSLEGTAVITAMTDEGIFFDFKAAGDTSALYSITLICGQTRPICMRRILREAVSLGAGRIILPVTDLGEKSYSSSSLYTSGGYRNILLDGAMQAGRTGVSECIVVDSADKAIDIAASDVLLLMDNVVGAEKLSAMDLRGKSVTVAIGPERGWSERERRLFMENGYIPSLLGSRILRSETAVSASLAVALTRMGLI